MPWPASAVVRPSQSERLVYLIQDFWIEFEIVETAAFVDDEIVHTYREQLAWQIRRIWRH